MPFANLSSGNNCGTKLGIAEVLFASVSSDSFSFGYSALFFHHFQFGYVDLDF